MFKFGIFILCLFGLSLAQNCGRTPYNLKSGRQLKIVGGVAANKSAWPWQIALKYKGSFICGGSIISPSWVVTAAHCTNGANAADFTIDVGLSDRLLPDTWSKTNLKVSKLIQHPSYVNSNTGIFNDIALFKLASPLTFVSPFRVNSVCLPTATNIFSGRTGVATGWGTLQSGGSTLPRNLMQVSLPVLSDSACASYFKTKGITIRASTQVCAGAVGGGKDTCQGDSGGPLVVLDAGVYKLAGITSFGIGCGDVGAYTKVSGFISWISSTIANN